MNINSTIAAVLMLIGITTTPTSVGGGLFWVLVVFLFALGGTASDPDRRWGFKRALWIAAIAFTLGIFGAVAHPAIPFVRLMPVEGAMGITGGLYPLWVAMPNKFRKFMREIALVVTNKVTK